MTEHLHQPSQNIDQAARNFLRTRNRVVSEYVPWNSADLGLFVLSRLQGRELPPPVQEEESPKRFVSGQGANIRAEASVNSTDIGDIWEELAVLGPDVTGDVVSGSPLWYKVQTLEGKIGYVHSSVVELRIEDRTIDGPTSLTEITFPEAAPDLIDGGSWEYQGQRVQLRVYTNLAEYEEKRQKFITLNDPVWDAIGDIWNKRFDEVAALPNSVLQLPVYEQNRGWFTDMRAADVNAAGEFQFKDEFGQFVEVPLETILEKGINYVLVNTPPRARIAEEEPSASRGQIYYSTDSGGIVSWSYKFDSNLDEGLTVYMYIGEPTYAYSGDEFKMRYASMMMFPVGVIWEVAQFQMQGHDRFGDNLIRTREHIVNRSWGHRQNGSQPWSKLLTGDQEVEEWRRYLLQFAEVTPF